MKAVGKFIIIKDEEVVQKIVRITERGTKQLKDIFLVGRRYGQI